jgi:hypothetical protein
VVLVVLLAVAACSSSSGGDTATPTSGAAPTSLEAAALAFARAYLTGTPDDILALQGPECLTSTRRPTQKQERETAKELARMRARLGQRLGVATSAIKFRGVRVRNVTATRGEAEVEYALPKSSAVGNYNWVEWRQYAGKWKVADCHPPIGGNSDSGSVAATTTSQG